MENVVFVDEKNHTSLSSKRHEKELLLKEENVKIFIVQL